MGGEGDGPSGLAAIVDVYAGVEATGRSPRPASGVTNTIMSNGKDEQIHIRIDKETKEKLSAISREKGFSVSATIREMVGVYSGHYGVDTVTIQVMLISSVREKLGDQPLGPIVENLLRRWADDQAYFRWAGADLRKVTGPGVYILWEDRIPLYVGMSELGLGRPFGAHHEQMEPSRDLATHLEFIPCETGDAARQMESEMIRQHVPLMNRRISGLTLKQRIRRVREIPAYLLLPSERVHKSILMGDEEVKNKYQHLIKGCHFGSSLDLL